MGSRTDCDSFAVYGVELTGAQVEAVFGVPVWLVVNRIRRHRWGVLRAVTTPAPGRNLYIGKRIGDRVIVSYAGDGKYRWECDCGASGSTVIGSLKAADSCRKCCGGGPERNGEGFRRGERHGTREILRYVGSGQYEWKCDCGATGKSGVSSLTDYECTSCGGFWRREAQKHVGEKHGSRLIVGVGDADGDGRRLYVWRCDCGESGESSYAYLAKKRACVSCYSDGLSVVAHGRVGERHGTRVIVSVAKGGGSKRYVWECDCGERGEAYYSTISKTSSCGRCKNYIRATERVGERHGSRTIIGVTEKDGKIVYGWKCDCGTVGSSSRYQIIARAKGCIYCKGKSGR